MLVARLVVDDRLTLHRLLGDVEIDAERDEGRGARGERRRRRILRVPLSLVPRPLSLVLTEHCDLERGERATCIAVTAHREEVDRIFIDRDVELAEAALGVRDRALDQILNLLFGKRQEREDLAAADERAVYREEWILRRRADQQHDAVLHVAKKNVLLRAGEAVDFIEEEHCPLAAAFDAGARRVEDLPHFLHADAGRVRLLEVALRVPGDQFSERRLPRARRPVEDQRHQPIRLEHPPQQLARTEKVLLPAELFQRAWPHPHGERRDLVEILPTRFGEEVHYGMVGEIADQIAANATIGHVGRAHRGGPARSVRPTAG